MSWSLGRVGDDAKRLIYIGERSLCGQVPDCPVRVTLALLRVAPKRGDREHPASNEGGKVRSGKTAPRLKALWIKGDLFVGAVIAVSFGLTSFWLLHIGKRLSTRPPWPSWPFVICCRIEEISTLGLSLECRSPGHGHFP
ncbi:hypothetical protein HNP29_000860 [Pseudomonas alcaligenes]|nr:hypothetical protein [Pseudomonas alcaligenes]